MVIHCPRCGIDLSDDANYCMNCGKGIGAAAKTGLPTAGGILAIICAGYCCLMGLLFIYAASSSYYSPYGADPRPTYFLIGIVNILAFALGLYGGILVLKRSKFRSAIIGKVVMNSGGIAISLYFVSQPYSGWLTALLFGAPIIVLSTLSITFIMARRNEFLLTRTVFLKPPTLPSPPTHWRSSSSTIRCLNCGHNNPDNFKYCGKCGTNLQEGETQIY